MPNRNVWVEQYKPYWQTANTPTPAPTNTPTPFPTRTPSPTPFTPWKSGATLNPLAAGRTLENMPVSTFTPYTETANDRSIFSPSESQNPWGTPESQNAPSQKPDATPQTSSQDAELRQIFGWGQKAYDPNNKEKPGIDPQATFEEWMAWVNEQPNRDTIIQAYRDAYGPASGNASSTDSSGSSPWSNPYINYYASRGVDPSWVSAFQQKHQGNDPITQYMSGNNPGAPDSVGEALFQADQDRQWGERFQRMYGRPPSENDWKASYWDRQAGYNNTNQATGGGW